MQALPQSRLLVLAVALFAAGANGMPAEPVHGKAYWQAVAADDFSLPEGASIEALVWELSGFLGSPDPELRDDIAYNTLTQWLYVQRLVPLDLRRELMDAWLANLRRGIGERGTDSVFIRSFSALLLSVATALDNEQPWLDDAEFDRLLSAALTYLHDEEDTRGFDPGKGWMHSVAHTADLLKFLARSRHLDVPQQSAILEALNAKLAALDHVPAHGEHERLARAVVSIAARPDADAEAFGEFLDSLKAAPPAGFPEPAELALQQNRKHLAVSLYALLATDRRASGELAAARERVRTLLQTMM